MQTSTLVLSLLVIFLHQGEAEVSSCLSCESQPGSPDPDCAEGNGGNISSVSCKEWENHGCVVMAMKKDDQMYWARGCCDETTCGEVHGSIDGDTFDAVGCFTDDCNT